MAVWSIVEISQLFGAMRMDAEFYHPKYKEAHAIVSRFPRKAKLGDIATKFSKGIFDIKAEEYVSEGVPFVRISNLKDGIVNEERLVFMTPERHKLEAKSALEKYDIILSKTAYPAASLVQIETCNSSQDTIAVSTACPEDFNVYLVVYLNTRFGILQMERLFQGNIQQHLSLFDARTITVPIPSESFQAEIRQMFESSIQRRQESKQLYIEAETLLLHELGIDTIDLSNQTTYTANFSETTKAHRFNAEYFQPKYYHILETLKVLKPKTMLPIGELLATITNGQTPRHHNLSVGDVTFLTAEHVFDFYIDLDSPKRILMEHHENLLSRTRLQDGDVLITIKGRVGNATVVEHLSGPTNINQDVALLRLNPEYHPYYVAGYLNSVVGKALTEQMRTGQINPFLGIGSLQKISIPIFGKDRMDELGEQIKQTVNQAYQMQQEAKRLLEEATHKVEEMILGTEV